MAEDANANIRIDIDTTAATAALKALQGQIARFHTEMARGGAVAGQNASKLQQDLINSINAGGQFQAGMTKVQSTTEAFTTALEKNKLSMGQYFRYAGASTKTFGRFFRGEFETITKVATERVKDLQTQYISMGRDANGALQSIKVRPLTLDMNDLATQTMITAQKQQLYNQLLKQGSTNLLNFGKNTQWAGRQLMVGFTLPLTLFASSAARSFMEIEKQVIRIRRVYGDFSTTVAETDQMIDSIKTLAGEYTKYGVAVSDTLGLAAEAAAAGKSGQELLAQISQATRLAVLGNVEQTQALETTMSVTNAFGVATEDLANKIDFLNAVENQSVTSIEDLTIAIPKAGPVVQQLGGDVEDLAFFLTAMKEGGINASEGANALKSGLAALINPTGKAKEMLQGFGINIEKIVNSNKGDIKGLVLDFASALDTLNPLDRARAIEQLFGKFQFSRLSTLFQNVIGEGTQASRVLELTKATTQELAILSQRELKKVEETTTYKFEKAFADFQAALAPVGEQFLKAITPVIEFGTKLLNQFNSMGDGAKSFAVILTTVVAGIGPVLLMTVGLVANGVANLIKMFQALGTIFKKSGADTTTLGLQTDYMTQQQIEAAAVAASLNQSHSKLSQTFSVEAAALNNLTLAYQKAVTAQRGFAMPGGRVAGSATKPKGFASGVVSVPGPKGKGDTVPAMLSPGEAVIPADMAKKYGGLIQGMVFDNIPGYSQSNIKKDVSMFGGPQRLLAPYTVGARGNTAGGFGVDRTGISAPDSIAELAMSMVAATLTESGTRISNGVVDSVVGPISSAAEEISILLQTTAEEMGDNATHISQVVKAKREEIDTILKSKSALLPSDQQGAFVSGSQRLLDPTLEDVRTGGYARVPAIRVNPDTGVPTKKGASWYTALKGKAQSFKAKLATLRSNPNFAGRLIGSAGTQAHLAPENLSMLGGMSPMGGAAMGLSPELQQPARQKLLNTVRLYFTKLGQEVPKEIEAAVLGGARAITATASPSQEMHNLGVDIGQGAINGLESKVDDAARAGESLGQAAASGTQAGARGQRGNRRVQTGVVGAGGFPVRTTPEGSSIIIGDTGRFIQEEEKPGKKPLTPSQQAARDKMIRRRAMNVKMHSMGGRIAAGVKGMGGMGAGMGLAMAGGAVGMIPGLQELGMAISLIGPLFMMMKPATVGVIAALGLLAYGIYKTIEAGEEQRKQALALGNSFAMGSKALQSMSEDMGTVSLSQKRQADTNELLTSTTEKQISAGEQYLTETDSGKALVDEIKTLQSNNMSTQEIGELLGNKISYAVSQNVITQQQGEGIIAALGVISGNLGVSTIASSTLENTQNLTPGLAASGAAKTAFNAAKKSDSSLTQLSGSVSALSVATGGEDIINSRYDSLIKELKLQKEKAKTKEEELLLEGKIGDLESQRITDLKDQRELQKEIKTYIETKAFALTRGGAFNAAPYISMMKEIFGETSDEYKAALSLMTDENNKAFGREFLVNIGTSLATKELNPGALETLLSYAKENKNFVAAYNLSVTTSGDIETLDTLGKLQALDATSDQVTVALNLINSGKSAEDVTGAYQDLLGAKAGGIGVGVDIDESAIRKYLNDLNAIKEATPKDGKFTVQFLADYVGGEEAAKAILDSETFQKLPKKKKAEYIATYKAFLTGSIDKGSTAYTAWKTLMNKTGEDTSDTAFVRWTLSKIEGAGEGGGSGPGPTPTPDPPVGGGGSPADTTTEDSVMARLQKRLAKQNALLNVISLKEAKINKRFDERKKALEEIAKLNGKIAEQQKGQLDVADALTRGDIASAARAVQAERVRAAALAQEQQMLSLERQRQAELANVMFKGKTREEVEAKIARLNMKIAKREYRTAASGGMIRGYASGGMMNGYSGGGMMKRYSVGGKVVSYFADGGSPLGSDTVPAMLTPGEFVIKRPAVQDFGVKNLQAINSGSNPSSGVYNYSISVNVSTEANPDQIARAVAQNVKRTESYRIRGNRL